MAKAGGTCDFLAMGAGGHLCFMATKKAASAKKTSRCWPGYEPVPGKQEHEQGSCKKKAASKSSPSEKKFQAKRTKQVDEWKKKNPGKQRSSAQNLNKPTA